MKKLTTYRKFLLTGGMGGFLFLGYLIYYFSFTHWIPAGYVGIIYNAQGGLQDKVYSPRAVTLGYFQQLYTYPTRIQNAVYTQDPAAGEIKAADGIAITTSDNANTTFDISVVYRVRPEDVRQVFKSFGPIPIADIQSQHIRRAVKEGASVIGSQYDLFALMGPKREEASMKLTAELRSRLAQKGITVERAMILTAYPTQNMSAKITTRVNSFIALDIAQLNSKIAEINRQSAIVTADASQKAQQIAASGVAGKAQVIIDLENVDAAIEKWNGHLSPYSKDSKVTLITSSGAGIGPAISTRGSRVREDQ
jgi:hypothetical protein